MTPKVDILINGAAESNRGKNFKYKINSLGKEFWGTFGSSILLTEEILPIHNSNFDISVGNQTDTGPILFDVENKTFGKPVNLGSNINTSLDENSPYYDKTTSTSLHSHS